MRICIHMCSTWTVHNNNLIWYIARRIDIHFNHILCKIRQKKEEFIFSESSFARVCSGASLLLFLLIIIMAIFFRFNMVYVY